MENVRLLASLPAKLLARWETRAAKRLNKQLKKRIVDSQLSFFIVGENSVLDKYGKPKICLKFVFAKKLRLVFYIKM